MQLVISEEQQAHLYTALVAVGKEFGKLRKNTRRSVDRVLDAGGFKSAVTPYHVAAARDEGYNTGYRDGQRAAERKKAKPA